MLDTDKIYQKNLVTKQKKAKKSMLLENGKKKKSIKYVNEASSH